LPVFESLGLVEYRRALEIQHELWERRVAGRISDTIVLCEHPLTYTIGSGGDERNLLADTLTLSQIGAKVHRIKRGGDVTCHSPGQLVAYPIIEYKQYFTDAHWYLRGLEQVIVSLLSRWRIRGERIDGLTGVWIESRKIASIGVKISRGVTSHGLALNVENDLRFFDYIRPCGCDLPVTSLSEVLGERVGVEEARRAMVESFEHVLGHGSFVAEGNTTPTKTERFCDTELGL
jgi:lipoyl(octanoyl) transferase